MRLRIWSQRAKVDLMWLKIRESVVVEDTTTCTDGCVFEGDDLGGIYATIPFSNAVQLDLYGFLFLRAPRSGEPPEASVVGIFGSRFLLKLPQARVSAEGIFQTGRLRQQTLLAFSSLLKARFFLPLPLRPFLGVQLMLGSGDADSSDNIQHAYLSLFSNRRKFYGWLNLFASSNIIQPVVEAGLQPSKEWSFSISARHSWKWTPQGTFLGGGNHAPVYTAARRDVSSAGWEIDSHIVWKPLPHFSTDLGGGVFLPTPDGALSDATNPKPLDPAFLLFLRLVVTL